MRAAAAPDALLDRNVVTRINPSEVTFTAIRAQGSGGQNVNKVSSAVHLRFDVAASSLPSHIKARLLALNDQRISGDGAVIIKAQTRRSQEQNKALALERLQALIDSVSSTPKPRKATKPTYASQLRRLKAKSDRSSIKQGRGRVSRDG